MQKFINALTQADQALAKLFAVIVAGTLFIEMSMVFIGVIARYFFNYPLSWVDELASMLLVTITFLGGYAAVVHNKLARVTAIVEKCSPVIAKILVFVCDLSIMFLMAIVAYYGFKFISLPVALMERSPVLRLPVVIFYTCIPVFGTLSLFHMLIATLEHLLISKKPVVKGEEGFAS